MQRLALQPLPNHLNLQRLSPPLQSKACLWGRKNRSILPPLDGPASIFDNAPTIPGNVHLRAERIEAGISCNRAPRLGFFTGSRYADFLFFSLLRSGCVDRLKQQIAFPATAFLAFAVARCFQSNVFLFGNWFTRSTAREWKREHRKSGNADEDLHMLK